MEPHSTPRKFLGLEDEQFDPHCKFDAARYLDKTRYFIGPIDSFPILFKSSSKTLDIGSKTSELPQK